MAYPDLESNVTLVMEISNVTTSCPAGPPVAWYDIILVCVQTVVCLLGITGSAVALKVLSRDNQALVVNFLLQVLCVADICYLSCCLIHFPIATFFRYMEMEDDLDPTWLYVKAAVFSLTLLTQLLTIWITVLIAAFRYIAIRFPHKAREVLTLPNAKYSVAAVVICVIIYCVPKFTMRVVQNNSKTNTAMLCKMRHAMDNFGFIYETVLFLIVILVLPLILLIVFNTRFIISYRHVKALRSRMNLKDKTRDHITILMIALLVVYIMCYAPVVTIYIAYKIYK